jgi:AcrR family transcriptional regulator
VSESSARRAQIVQSAARLFAERGVGGTSVRDIADSVGVLSGSLYHHFVSKDALVVEILSSYLEDLVAGYREVVEADLRPRESVHGLVLASLTAAEAHPHATEIYQNELGRLRERPNETSSLTKAAAEVQRTWLSVLRAGVEAGDLRDDVPVTVFYRFIRDALFLSARWYRPGADYPVTRFAEHSTSLFLDGCSAVRRPTRARARR